MNNFIYKFSKEKRVRGIYKSKPAGVYVFKGTYIRFKNQNCRFSGKVKKVFIDIEKLFK